MQKDKWKSMGVIVLVLLVFLVITCTIGLEVIQLASDPIKFQAWLEQWGMFKPFIMIALVFLQVVIAWLPGEIFEVGAGYVFGFWQGSLLVLLGSFLATWFVMVMVKKFGTKLVYRFFSKDKVNSLSFLHNQQKMKKYLFIAFFIPGSPKDVLTYFVGLTEMKVLHVLLITTVARIPSVITSTMTGTALGNDNYLLAIASFAFTLIISAVGLWGYNKFAQRKQLKLKQEFRI